MTATLSLIRVLRRLPHTDRFDRHLTDCAAHEVFYQDEDAQIERLTIRHVLRLDPLPCPFVPASGRPELRLVWP